MTLPRITVVVSTYNSPRYLELVLTGLVSQTVSDFKVIVADDGSTEETRFVIDSFFPRLNLLHCWQKDAGFRLAAVRNLALSNVSTELVAFLDGDCIPHRNYVADILHCFNALEKRRAYLQGHRVILDKAFSERLAADGSPALPSLGLLARNVFHFSNRFNAIRRPFFPRVHFRLKGVRGCNMAFRMEDLVAVNGFDESFEGWGHEDQDLVRRLFASGVGRCEVRGRMIVYHLYHPEHDRDAAEENLLRARSPRPARAAAGIVRGNPNVVCSKFTEATRKKDREISRRPR